MQGVSLKSCTFYKGNEMSDEVHQDNVSDSNTPSVEELQAKVASLEKAANDYKGDMFKYKEEGKAKAEKLEALQAKMPSEERLTALENWEKAERERLEKEAELDPNKANKLRKAELEALTQKQERERKELEAQLNNYKSTIRDLTVNTQITNAAAEFGAIKPEQVIQLIGSTFDVVDDDGKMRVVALDKSGEPIRGEDGLLTVKEAVSTYLNDNPHLVKPSEISAGTGGKGSVTQTQQPTLTANEALQLVRSGKMTKQEANSMLRVGKAIKE